MSSHTQSVHSHPFICFECGTIASMWKSGHREDNISFSGDQSCLFCLSWKKKKAKTKREFGSSDKSDVKAGWSTFAFYILFVSHVLIMCSSVTVYNIQNSWYWFFYVFIFSFTPNEKKKSTVLHHCLYFCLTTVFNMWPLKISLKFT